MPLLPVNQDNEELAILAHPSDSESILDCDAYIQTDTDPHKTRYDEILNKSRTKVIILLSITLAEPFITSSRSPFLVLFIQSFAPHITTQTISIFVFASSAWFASTTLIFTSLGDRYGHDRLLIISLLCLCIGQVIECLTYSFPIFVLGQFIAKAPNIPIAFAYIPRVLPHKYAVRYCAILWTIGSAVYLLGPVMGAVVVNYSSYRMIWIVNLIVHSIGLFVAILTLRGSVQALETEQSRVGLMPSLENDEQFPICIQNKKEQRQKEMVDSHFWCSLLGCGDADGVMLLLAILMNNATWAMEAVVIYYYVLFMMNNFETNALDSALMMVELSVLYGIANLLLPRIIKRILPRFVWVILLCSVCFAVVSMACAMNRNHVEYYWGYNALLAISFGPMAIASEMCILELQPVQHSGKVAGFKGCIKYTFRGLAAGLVGFFWSSPRHLSLWYGLAVLSVAVLFFAMVLGHLALRKSRPKH